MGRQSGGCESLPVLAPDDGMMVDFETGTVSRDTIFLRENSWRFDTECEQKLYIWLDKVSITWKKCRVQKSPYFLRDAIKKTSEAHQISVLGNQKVLSSKSDLKHGRPSLLRSSLPMKNNLVFLQVSREVKNFSWLPSQCIYSVPHILLIWIEHSVCYFIFGLPFEF